MTPDDPIAARPVGPRATIGEPEDEPPRRTRGPIVHDHTIVADRDRDDAFSIGATFLGWNVAAFLNILFLAIIGAILGTVAFNLTAGDPTPADGDLMGLGVVGAIGVLLAIFLAYLVGGYAAGRIGHWNGMKHGAIVPLWGIAFWLTVGLIGASLGTAFAGFFGDLFAGVNVNVTNLTAGGIVAALLALAAAFGGAILGGRLGEESDEKYLGYEGTTRRVRGTRTL